MKKKLVAIVVALALVIALIPTLALADVNQQEANNACSTCGEVSGEVSGGAVVSYGTLDEVFQSRLMKRQVKKALAEQGIEITPELTVYKVTMPAGSSVIDYFCELYDKMWRDFDIFIFILTGTGTWKMDIKDGFIMGDTMKAMGRACGTKVSGQATSPDVIHLGPVSGQWFALGIVIAGYTDCPGGFPAGYYFSAWY